MTVIHICEVGHRSEFNLLKGASKFPSKWRCQQRVNPMGEDVCGRPLLSPESVIVLPGLRPE